MNKLFIILPVMILYWHGSLSADPGGSYNDSQLFSLDTKHVDPQHTDVTASMDTLWHDCSLSESDPVNLDITHISRHSADSGLFSLDTVIVNPAGDITDDGKVNIHDLLVLSRQWLNPPQEPTADIYPNGGDGLVDLNDLSIMAADWLWGVK